MNQSANLSGTQITRTYTIGPNKPVFCVIRFHWRSAQKTFPLMPHEITDPTVTSKVIDVIEGDLDVDIHLSPQDQTMLHEKMNLILATELASMNAVARDRVPYAPGAISFSRSVWRKEESELGFAQHAPVLCERIVELLRLEVY